MHLPTPKKPSMRIRRLLASSKKSWMLRLLLDLTGRM
jgi:hypothetical protein